MTGKLIDGRAVAAAIYKTIKQEMIVLKQNHNIIPTLAVVVAGDDLASHRYVNMIEGKCREIGVSSQIHRLPSSCSQEELIELITSMNQDDQIHGVLLQLPLPALIDEKEVNSQVKAEKDVDGFHATNVGNLFLGDNTIYPCTPKGIMRLIKSTGIEIKGKNAVVIGRSNIVGKPAAIMLLNENATVTICHSRTKNLKEHVIKADILVVAVGKTDLITSDMIKEGAVVIDAGTNIVSGKITGDVEFDKAREIASFITPVPGGVGPMTIAMLIENTVEIAKKKCK
ncbi:MAG: bifunctional 5,10-methylene-tetrahydrofolate dehydrogenase/5,10-methylene-tetrahydrofolate cyclohydrolase [Alkaliphilus sp.]|nr:bifunctional 5,10-methylene-tetrahydrofolate dehydrogenase/5,10-methylene-tetrahydrofolate cyclohydrolase [Alkaliphilus sp. AH-315-G20]PHS36517.1 MAG: bifunctional 5,10-methylene-tetrahydrofolate dehydrogenase/5,10-methylene-tetrahydrofolate cyclohydrolase [Alkaliphilus sp.]